MRTQIVVLLLCVVPISWVNAQSIYSLNTKWDEEVDEWVLKLDDGEVEGEIEMTWRIRNDMTDWRYRISGKGGTIKQKWDNNPNFWELRSGATVITVSTIWSGDFNSFRITDGNTTIRIERISNTRDPIEWRARDMEDDLFYWYNEYEYDIRDWIVEDHLSEAFLFEVKLAAVFISVLHSI